MEMKCWGLGMSCIHADSKVAYLEVWVVLPWDGGGGTTGRGRINNITGLFNFKLGSLDLVHAVYIDSLSTCKVF